MHPLVLPDQEGVSNPAVLARAPAVALFVARARSIQPEFVLARDNGRIVAEICRRLDGLPLAIELAAARIKVLPPQAMLTRLAERLPLLVAGARDLPGRHQALRVAIAWSEDLLEPEERTVRVTLMLTLALVLAGGVGLGWAQVGMRATTVLQTTTTAIGQPLQFPLFRNQFTGVIIELAPGGQVGRHMHPAPNFVYVLEGAITIEAEGHPTRTYSAGDTFVESVNTGTRASIAGRCR